MTPDSSKPPRKRRPYSTGDVDLDTRIHALVDEVAEKDRDLVFEIITTAVRLARDETSRLDRKIANSALKEMRYAFRVFAPYRNERKVSVFGSARTCADDPEFQAAREFSRAIAERGWMVVTGAGPGIMEAAQEGAGGARSFGVNIRLPFEAKANPFIADDPKLINFKYFFTRKLMFIKEGDAFVLLPGGFGTLDEAFELLTLIQTGKSDLHPIVLLDHEGGHFWQGFDHFVRTELLNRGYVSPDDLQLYKRAAHIDEAVAEIERFYRNYHSQRVVRGKFVLRLQRLPSADRIHELSKEFSDIFVGGTIEVADPTPEEVRDDDALDKPRLAFAFDRMHFGRLRQLIDRLNEDE
ncbi:MAG: TIGR00730 family Rossman fold protein [Actinomycetota bacterium]